MSSLTLMPSRKKAAVLMAAGGYVNTSIVIIQGLFLMPMYLYYIGSHTYGLWLASGGILAMLSLMNFGIGSMLIQRVSSFYAKCDFEKSGLYFFNGMIVYLGISIFFGIVGWGVSVWLPDILTVEGDDGVLLQQCFQVAIVSMVLSIVNECFRSFSQALLRPLVPVAGMAVGRILGISVTIWMLLHDWGLWSIPMGLVVTEIFTFIVNLLHVIVLIRGLGVSIILKGSILKEYMRTAPALLGARLGQGLAQESEPLLITLFLTPEITAVYMIVRRAADIVFRLLMQASSSVLGSFCHLVGSGDGKVSAVAYALIALIALLGMTGFSIYIVMNESFIRLWVGDEYLLSSTVTFLLGVSFFFQAIRGLVWLLLNGTGDFVYTSVCMLFEGGVRIGLIIFFMPLIGVVSVPLALLVASIISLYILARRMQEKLPYMVDGYMVILYVISLLTIFSISFFLGGEMYLLSWLSFSVALLVITMVYFTFTVLFNWNLCVQLKLILSK